MHFPDVSLLQTNVATELTLVLLITIAKHPSAIILNLKKNYHIQYRPWSIQGMLGHTARYQVKRVHRPGVLLLLGSNVLSG